MTLGFLSLLLALRAGCEDKAPDEGSDTEQPPAADADADADADTDADADADADADGRRYRRGRGRRMNADADADVRTVGGQAWCASAASYPTGVHSDGLLRSVDLSSAGTATDGTHTWQPGPITRIAP